MAFTLAANLDDARRQQVNDNLALLYETNTPTSNEIKKSAKKRKIDDAGYRIRKLEVLPGGHTFYSGASSSYNEPFPAQTLSMFAYPTRYALAMQYDVALLESLKEGKSEHIVTLLKALETHAISAGKRMNQLFHGSGDGVLAYSTTVIAAAATNATLGGETAAALSAGHTKGTAWLEKGHKYDAVNPATGVVRGTFQVVSPGKSQCVVNMLSGTVVIGDAITDVGAYLRAPRGLAHLVSPTNRLFYGVDTTVHPEFNCPEIDLNGANISSSDIEDIRTKLQTRTNDADGVTTKCVISHGIYSVLKKQGFGFRQYQIGANGEGNVSTGVAGKYIESDTKFIRDSDACDDRAVFFTNEHIEYFSEKEIDVADWDGNEWRMWLGANGYGSDIQMRALTWRGAYGPGEKADGRTCALIRRANLTNTVTQVNAG
jgi:hypothetical protein